MAPARAGLAGRAGRPLAGLAGLVTRRRARAYAVVVLATTAVAAAGAHLTGPGLLDRFGQVKGADFMAFYVAGRLVGAGRGAELYAFEPPFRFPAQCAVEAAVLAPQPLASCHAFVLPAFFALPFVLLAALPYLAALGLWSALAVACLFLALRLLRPDVELLRGPDRRTATLLAASFLPYLESLLDGQNTALTLLLLAASYASLRAGRDGLAGVALGLLLYKPQLALPLALLLPLARRWRAAAAFAATGAALVALFWLVAGPRGLLDYLVLVDRLLTVPYVAGWRTWNMHSWHGFFALLLGEPTAAGLLTLAASLATLALVVTGCWRADPADRGRFGLQLALATLGATLLSPHLFGYDLAILILPGLLLADAARRGEPPAARGAWLRLLLAALYLTPLVARAAALGLRFQPTTPVVALALLGTWALLWYNRAERVGTEEGT